MPDEQKPGRMPFNVNSYVYVRLTSRARAALRKEYEDFWERLRGVSVPLDYKPHPYAEPSVDADGYTAFQFWKFMELFGPILNMGTDLRVWFEDGAVIQVQTGG